MIRMWIKVTYEYLHARYDINWTIDSYHGIVKQRHTLHKKFLKKKKLEWFIRIITENLEIHYWYIKFLKKQGYTKNMQRYDLIQNIILRSKNININNILILLQGSNIFCF